MKKRTITAADLFCGAGGTSTGLELACEELGFNLNLLAINHWDTAIETHTSNHPDAAHLCMNVDQVDPRKAVSSGKLDMLIASPECTHHSIARGGKPINDQSRASAWLVLRWAEALDIKNILIENVPEFQTWGPLKKVRRPVDEWYSPEEEYVPFRKWIKDARQFGGTKEEWQKIFGDYKRKKKKRTRYHIVEIPDPKLKGKTFLAFINALESLGYTVRYQIVNAANHGDPTTRKRLFILARKGRRAVVFPEPTHTADGRADLFGKTKKWRAAREIIDWTIKGESIYDRKKPLSPNTMRRIFAGLQKFSGGAFVMGTGGPTGQMNPRSVEEPLRTVLTDGRLNVFQPFLVSLRGTTRDAVKSSNSSIDKPVPTITANGNHEYLAEPFVLNIRGGNDGYLRGASVDEPLQAITTEPAMALVEPFVLGQQSQGRARSTKNPLPTIATDGAIALVEPFIVPTNHGPNDTRTHSVEKPMPTVMAFDSLALAQPFILPNEGVYRGNQARSVDQPVPTITQNGAGGIVEPYLVQYNGASGPQSVNEPLPTQPTHDKFGLAEPIAFQGEDGQTYVLDIRFRMLQPKELAAAMSFPADYKFSGNREKVVKQIGNAVAVQTAKALCKALLG